MCQLETNLQLVVQLGAIRIYFPRGCSCDIRIVHYHLLSTTKHFRELCSTKNQRKKILETPFAHELSPLVTFLSLFHTPKIPKNSKKFHVCVFQVSNHWGDKGFVVFGISLGWLVGWVGLGCLAERIKRREKKKKITRDSKCKCPMLRLKSGLPSKFKSNIFWAQ
jgi:hypothetical protein